MGGPPIGLLESEEGGDRRGGWLDSGERRSISVLPNEEFGGGGANRELACAKHV